MLDRNDRALAHLVWQAHPDGSKLTIELVGELDMSVGVDFEASMREWLGHDVETVTLDLSGVAFMDSTGLRIFTELRNDLSRHGKQLLLGPMSGQVKRLLDVSGLYEWFDHDENGGL